MFRSVDAARSRVAIAALLAAALLTAALPALAATSTDPVTAAEHAAAWIADRISPAGGYGSDAVNNVGRTIEAALTLAAADAERAAFDRAVAFVEANYDTWVKDGNGVDRPGALGHVAVLAAAAGRNPRAFGGSDLVARIEAGRTPAGPDAGMYGTLNTFAAVFLHSWAMLGLKAAGVTPPEAAVTWLRAQQCDNGGWMAYRSATQRTQNTCGNTETDATALALQALRALGRSPFREAGAYLASVQSPSGGFPASTGDANANSTGLAVQAIVALGEDPAGGRWRQADGDTPMSALLAFQFGCDSPDAGALAYLAGGGANTWATAQGTWGLALAPLPITGAPGAYSPASCGAARPQPSPSETTSPTPDPSPSTSPSPSPTASPDPVEPVRRIVRRVAGPSRYDSAVAVSQATFPSGSSVAYLATGAAFPDALAAGPAAAVHHGPVLLTAADNLPTAVAEELARLAPNRIIVLGGTSAVSQRVAAQAAAYAPVERIAGHTRYETAATLSRTSFGRSARVLLATGSDFPDALAGIAASEGGPILLTERDRLPAVTESELHRLEPEEVLVLGGTAAVSEMVLDHLRAVLAVPVRRVAGPDRYQTAVAVVRSGVDEADVAFVATGRGFPDALAGAAAAGLGGTGILLVPGDDVPAVVLDELARLGVREVVVLGGTSSVSEQAERRLAGG